MGVYLGQDKRAFLHCKKMFLVVFLHQIYRLVSHSCLGVGVFVSVEMGMIVGTFVHLAILLYSSTTPKIQVNQVQVRTHFIFTFKRSEDKFIRTTLVFKEEEGLKITQA